MALVTDDADAGPAGEQPLPEVRFAAPLPGLDGLTRYELIGLDDTGALFTLRSLEREGTRLIVASPWVCAPQYAPTLDDAVCADLGLERAEDAMVLVVVNPGPSLADSTVNLLAPLVVNRRTGAAAQVVLTQGDHPLRAPLVAA